MVASVWATYILRAKQAVNTPASQNREEQPNMTNEKVIMLIEAKIQPQRRAELVDAISQYVPLVRAEPCVETFYVTARKDDPNTFVFYEVYRSHAAQDFHLQQNFTWAEKIACRSSWRDEFFTSFPRMSFSTGTGSSTH
jgi:quinol monooxygenase YgiN